MNDDSDDLRDYIKLATTAFAERYDNELFRNIAIDPSALESGHSVFSRGVRVPYKTPLGIPHPANTFRDMLLKSNQGQQNIETNDKRKSKMSINIETAASLCIEDTFTVGVSFQGGNKDRVYQYKSTIKDLAKGDTVVVPTTIRGETLLQVATVASTVEGIDLDIDDDKDYKWVVAKVDFTEYDKVKALEAELVADLKAKRRAKARRDAMTALFGDDGVEPLKISMDKTDE